MQENEKGFTLIELLIVMSIIFILSSMSLILYQKYREKSFVTARLLPIADACARDIMAYCIDLDVNGDTVVDIASVNLENCKSRTLINYNLKVDVSGTFTCTPGGTVSGGTVYADTDNTSTFRAKCSLDNDGIKCGVDSK